MELFPSDLQELQRSVREGDLDLPELVRGYLSRIREQNESLNLFIETFGDEAEEKAGPIQKRIRRNEHGPLAGLVIALKDNICIKDQQVSAGSRILEGFTSLYDATVVQRLKDADAIIIGRTNCDEFAMGSSNENSYYGPSRNPIDPERVPGGSSGASAAAVKTGMCMAALGSDTGGSVRQPASFCDVVGLKPTYGRVSRHGLVAYASSFDQIGPITNNVGDAARILSVIAGADEYDSTCADTEVPELSELPAPKKPLRIAYLEDVLDRDGVDPEIRERTRKILEKAREDGHEIKGERFGYLDHLVPCYQVLSNAEASSNLARYDGIHFGYRNKEAEGTEETYLRSRTEGFGPEVKRRIMLGTFVLSAGYYDAYFGKAQKVRRLIRERTLEILGENDLILIPTSPETPFKVGEKLEDPISMYLQDIFTVQANLAGIPAISLPLGKHSNGLPFGVQLMGAPFAEEALLSAAASLMKARS